jgi:hypothetical protein
LCGGGVGAGFPELAGDVGGVVVWEGFGGLECDDVVHDAGARGFFGLGRLLE